MRVWWTMREWVESHRSVAVYFTSNVRLVSHRRTHPTMIPIEAFRARRAVRAGETTTIKQTGNAHIGKLLVRNAVRRFLTTKGIMREEYFLGRLNNGAATLTLSCTFLSHQG
mmetsp:Transcript_23418/g.39730  ORF Transcript_23418/g.39730 Transcript_23418/m.39730 type:complete len:112 (-) Transcript_23418:1579-1914(-)